MGGGGNGGSSGLSVKGQIYGGGTSTGDVVVVAVEVVEQARLLQKLLASQGAQVYQLLSAGLVAVHHLARMQLPLVEAQAGLAGLAEVASPGTTEQAL